MLKQNLAQRQLMWLALGCILLLAPAAASAQSEAGAGRQVVAVIDDKHVITQQEVDELLGPRLVALEEQIYALRKNAIEGLVTERLLRERARARGVTLEEYKDGLTPAKVNVTPLRVEEEYAKHAHSMGEMGEDEAKQRLKIELEGIEKLKAYKDALARIRGEARVLVTLPAPPSKVLLTAGGPTKGPDSAPVQLVEFSDFQCPYCKRAQGFLGEVLREYGAKVQHVFKHLPLTIHPEAFAAAQASYCAGRQGKFWEFHDRLFASDDLKAETLKKYAGELALDAAEFGACLESESSRAAVLKDMAEARRANVEGTPTFFINGKPARGIGTAEDLRRAIDAELRDAAAGEGSR